MLSIARASNIPIQTTWAAKPAVKGWYEITDVGVNGSIWFYNGTKWIHEAPIVIRTKGKGWLVPSLITANAATYSQTGTTITVTSTAHNIPNTTYNGYDVYLVIGTGAAVSGWFTNFTYVDANSFTCTSTVSQSTSGAVNTNTSETTVTELTATIPGGLLGLNGSIRAHLLSNCISSGDAKTPRIKLGGTSFLDSGVTTNIANSRLVNIYNRNSNTLKYSFASNGSVGLGSGGTGNTTSTVDTSSDQDLTVTLQCAAASSFVAASGYCAEVIPS